jgi:hypothetical protein
MDWRYVVGVEIVVVILNINYALGWAHWELERGKWQDDKKFLLLRKVLWPFTYSFEINKLDDDDRPVMVWKRSGYLTCMMIGGVQLKMLAQLVGLVTVLAFYPITGLLILMAYTLQIAILPTRLMGLNSFTLGTDLRRSLWS